MRQQLNQEQVIWIKPIFVRNHKWQKTREKFFCQWLAEPYCHQRYFDIFSDALLVVGLVGILVILFCSAGGLLVWYFTLDRSNDSFIICQQLSAFFLPIRIILRKIFTCQYFKKNILKPIFYSQDYEFNPLPMLLPGEPRWGSLCIWRGQLSVTNNNFLPNSLGICAIFSQIPAFTVQMSEPAVDSRGRAILQNRFSHVLRFVCNWLNISFAAAITEHFPSQTICIPILNLDWPKIPAWKIKKKMWNKTQKTKLLVDCSWFFHSECGRSYFWQSLIKKMITNYQRQKRVLGVLGI